MNNFQISNKDISELVNSRLKTRELSIRECVNNYNKQRDIDKNLQEAPKLNKDFLLRVKNNKFEVANVRVAKLCDYLDIPINVTSPRKIFQSEFERVEALVDGNPQLREHIGTLLGNIVEFATKINRAKQ